VAVALRNRWRRQKLPPELRDEVVPRNILMIGPTGVGKTEIARRLAALVGAPFIKVEATKYTEVGYHGRDVESMIRDLVKSAVADEERAAREAVAARAAELAEERLLDALLPSGTGAPAGADRPAGGGETPGGPRPETRERLRRRLRAGDLDAREVEIETRAPGSPIAGVMTSMGDPEAGLELQEALESLVPRRSVRRRLGVAEARRVLAEEVAGELIDREAAARRGLEKAQNLGIVFIDELDKLVSRGEAQGPEVSRAGVQRDLLPFIEGCSVATRWGLVRTDHMLFIAAGAFSQGSPADLLPELQGRLPIRVALEPLGAKEFERILTEPDSALVRQAVALMSAEGVELSFEPGAVRRIAEIAAEANSRAQNIGARRLATVMEKLLEELSFTAPERRGERVTVTAATVEERLAGIVQDADVARFIL